MKNMGGEKVINIRVPYETYCLFDDFVRINKVSKTKVIVDFLNSLKVKPIKPRKPRLATEFLKELEAINRKKGIVEDESIEYVVDTEGL